MLFDQLGLDERLLKDVARLGWSEPTFIQEKAIPHVLAGKDVIAQGRTGSGKTGAYLLPYLNQIINIKQQSGNESVPSVKLIILAPSKELCNQIYSNVEALCTSCRESITFIDISPTLPLPVQKTYLAVNPDIVIATPSRILAHLAASSFSVKTSLMGLVIDEADLLFSFGYAEEMRSIVGYLPSSYQAFITSATITPEMKELKSLYLQNPVIVKQKDDQASDDASGVLPPPEQLEHYKVSCSDDVDKYVVLVSLLKLHLLRGRTLIFVNNVDRAYRLRLVLEQFGLATAILNPQLPASVRIHSLDQFNSGRTDRIIACDMEQNTGADDDSVAAKKLATQPSSKEKKSSDFSIARGIDFDAVANVVNFDFPTSVKQYVHRVGRTARGVNSGTALSLVNIGRDMQLFESVQKECGVPIKTYQLRMEELDGFRYRVRDAVQAATRSAVKEARLKEIKRELLNSEKLKRHFAANPRDLAMLQHDKSLFDVKHGNTALRSVPDYIVPKSVKRVGMFRNIKHQQIQQKGTAGPVLIASKRRQELKKKRFGGKRVKKDRDPLKSLRA